MLKEDNYNCNCCLYLDNWWENYKYTIAPKLAVTISILGGVGSILLNFPSFTLPASIILGFMNIGVFFAGLTLEHFKNEDIKNQEEKKNLETDNISLKNQNIEMNNRLSIFQFPTDNSSQQLSNEVTPKSDATLKSNTTNPPDKFFDTPINIDKYLNKRETLKPSAAFVME